MAGSTKTAAEKANDAGACGHCGALVYHESVRCYQCGKFPVKLHQCPKCKSIASLEAVVCWKCGKGLNPDGDFL